MSESRDVWGDQFLTEVAQLIGFFFFSSRRRHTSLQGDWSSDVCSSDLDAPSGREVAVPGMLTTNQCTQLFATGCGSTIESANDRVSGGVSAHSRGRETFFPPTTP